MLLYAPDGCQNRADDHEPFLGSSVFKQYFNPGFESAPVQLSTRNIERSVDSVAHNLISGGTFDRKPARSLMSSRNMYRK